MKALTLGRDSSFISNSSQIQVHLMEQHGVAGRKLRDVLLFGKILSTKPPTTNPSLQKVEYS